MGSEANKQRAAAKYRLEQAKTQMYQELILDCAERLFARSGFDHVTMRDIAREAGISPKTLYSVFPGKDDIYGQVAKRRSLALLDAVRDNMTAEGPVLERLGRGTRALVRFLVEHPAFFEIMMRESRSWGLLPTGDGSGDWRAGHRMQADLMRAGIEEGVFYAGDPDVMAAISISTMQVLLAAALERPGKPDSDAIAEEVFVQLQRSLRKLPPFGLESSKTG